MRLRVDDDVHRLPYTWYGPKLDGFLAMFRFKGRTLTEWAIMVPLFVAGWVWGVPLFEMLTPSSDGPLSFLLLRFGLSWFGASYAAKTLYLRFVDPDRPPKYVVRCAAVEAWRVMRARGPVDPAVAVVGVVAWWLIARLAVLLPLPRLWSLGLAVVAACWVARRVVARFQSPDRAWRFRHARLSRSARFEAIEVTP